MQLAEEEGDTLEQLFTRWATDLLAEGGETENVRLAYDEKAFGTKSQHKINAYAISDNYETVDLFISLFKCTDEPTRIGKDEIKTSAIRISNFFRKGMYKSYENEIEESSPIFDFAHTLAASPELKENLVRVNVFILTDGLYPGDPLMAEKVSGQTVYYRIIDLEYLSNISEKAHIPIEIDFQSEGFDVPCIHAPSENEQYQSYLAIVPGAALATIYERYGSRLLEQNVRSFLQFTGKINKGIRGTILEAPHMFLAYNNGLAATAEAVEIVTSADGSGRCIAKVQDLQIVNGGQTTASIFHTCKKDRADLSEIYVQLKLSVVKNKASFSDIVGRIAEYANTQNKVSVSDLSSNRPFHVELEKISRTTVTPHITGQTVQTYWFYERARGQYRNARSKDGFTPARQRAFDLKYPKPQVFSKEDLAKYVNAFSEVWEQKKLVIGPHFVVQGNQKNYVRFINHNIPKAADNIYFEDAIAKMILFRTAEKIYGVKPNAIGDMRYITVPYTLSLLAYTLNNQLDLYKIWRAQAVSEELKTFLYSLMVEVEAFIKKNAPGALYGEWAKKEACWEMLKNAGLVSNVSTLKADLLSGKSPSRKRITDSERDAVLHEKEEKRIRAVPPTIWASLEDWARTSGMATDNQLNALFNIIGKVRGGKAFTTYEHTTALKVLDLAIEHVPELLAEINSPAKADAEQPEISLEIILQLLKWDQRHKRLKDTEFIFLSELAAGQTTLTDYKKKNATEYLNKAKKYGFRPE